MFATQRPGRHTAYRLLRRPYAAISRGEWSWHEGFWAVAATLALGLAACGSGEGSGGAGGGGSIRVALGDIESVETLGLTIALERVRARGTDVELIELADEDFANQAVVGGQADIGLGAPYGLIQGSGAPLRIVCQLQRLRFFPVVDKAAYPDWQALDGETFTVHSRGSTTEALARIVEQDEGIEFGEISFVPGAEVRATALLRGNVDAAVLDIPNKNYVMGEAPGRFHVLPTPETGASDEMLFGNTEWMEQNQESVRSCSRRSSRSGARWPRTPGSSRTSGSGSGCCPTCRPSSRSSCSPTTSRLPTRVCSPRTAAARRPRGTSSTTRQPGSSKVTRRTFESRTSGASASSSAR